MNGNCRCREHKPVPYPRFAPLVLGISLIVISGTGWPERLVPSSDLRVAPAEASEQNRQIRFNRIVVDDTMSGAHFALPADFDGDGDLDLVATSELTATVAWYENTGELDFVRHDIDTDLDSAYPASVRDLDRDGDVDILAAGFRANLYVWYENDGVGNFRRHDIDSIAGPHSIVARDLDKDGDHDLVATSQLASRLVVYMNDGRQRFRQRVIDNALGRAKYATPADLNGDGFLDIVGIGDNYPGVLNWYENDGRGRFSKHEIGLTPGGYFVVATDIDRDGDSDVISASRENNRVTLFRNDGAGNFEEIVVDDEAYGARAVFVKNLDRRRGPDILSASVDDNTIAWYEQDRNGNFTKHVVDDTVIGAYGVNAADMDGDGLFDVISAGRDDGTISVHRQIPH